MVSSKFTFSFLRDIEHGGNPQQTQQIAHEIADFISKAKHSIHIAIYDFRLTPDLANIVITALKQTADRGVDVKIAYDHQKKKESVPPTEVEFETNDPKPRGTHVFMQQEFVESHSKVLVKPIESAKLMHSKFILRDSETSSATILMGSANFTDDAWTFQENNIVTIKSKQLAFFYEKDFTELWTKGNISETGKNDGGTVTIGGAGGIPTDVDFSPGDGTLIGKHLASYIGAASHRLLVSSMMITSGAVLGALSDSLKYHPNMLRGVYDNTQMETNAIHSHNPMNPQKIALFNTIKPHLWARNHWRLMFIIRIRSTTSCTIRL